MSSNLNTHLIEIRFKANSKILDKRGEWAAALSEKFGFTKWKVDPTHFEVKDFEGLDANHVIFVSYNKAGISCRNTTLKKEFPDLIHSVLERLFQFDGFENKPLVNRIGVRSRFCTNYRGSFDKLLESYSSKFITVPSKTKELLNAEIIDIGSPINMKDELGNINLMGGPMKTNQIIPFFQLPDSAKDVPAVGLVFDLDYWETPELEMEKSDIEETCISFANASWDLNERLKQYILE